MITIYRPYRRMEQQKVLQFGVAIRVNSFDFTRKSVGNRVFRYIGFSDTQGFFNIYM